MKINEQTNTLKMPISTPIHPKGLPGNLGWLMGVLVRSVNFLPIGIAFSAITIAQVHGAPFWIALVGSESLGWGVSLTWESSSIWLWWRGDSGVIYRLAKWTATLALVLGMLTQSVGSVLNLAETKETKAVAMTQIGRLLEDTLSMAKNQGRRGWQGTINEALGIIGRVATEPPQQKQDSAPGLHLPPWMLRWVIAPMTVVLFPALYALGILAIKTIGQETPMGQQARNRPSTYAREPQERPERRALVEYAKRHGLESQRMIAEQIRESPSTLSEFANGRTSGEVHSRIHRKLHS